MKRIQNLLLALAMLISWHTPSYSEPLEPDVLRDLIIPPFSLGDRVNDKGVWTLLNSGGSEAGYVFETEPLAPLPGFSGSAINVLVSLDLEGRFMEARLIEHNEPIFVSGLGEAPFYKFFEQYRGLSIASTMVVGTPYGDNGSNGSLVYLDGMTKATASVRIAHESILAATFQVAREKMKGVQTKPPAFPKPNYQEDLTWDDIVAQGLVGHLRLSNSQVDAKFADTLWEDDDPEAQDFPEDPYIDLWVLDVGPDSLARAVFEQDTLDELAQFKSISEHDEPILVIETARHGLVSKDFVRTTSPSLINMEQNGLPIALRDSDLFVSLKEDVPDGVALILRTDRRLGFDPASQWTFHAIAQRSHGMFQSEIGKATLSFEHTTHERFFDRMEPPKTLAPWVEALINRQQDLIAVGIVLTLLSALLFFPKHSFRTQLF